MTRSIFVVIVLYRIEVKDCLSLNSFLRAAQAAPFPLKFEVLLYDNTPEPHSHAQFPADVSYVHDASNSGLATAYNLALKTALDNRYEWLLTLDQDTEIPLDGLSQLWAAMEDVAERPDVAAIAPQIEAADRIVSPNYFKKSGRPAWFPSGFRGIPRQATFAFNSGSLLRVTALRQVGGYSPWFWLDNSDANLYRHLAKFGKRVFVAGDLVLHHDFSMLDMQQKVSPARYKNILLAESAFWDLEMSGAAGLERTTRLAGRMIKHILRGDSAELRRLTFHGLLLRLFRSRRYRVARWRKLTAQTIANFSVKTPLSMQPKISVCMAAYNGQRYILEQLRSIAPQLGAGDELIIVDDASQDDTGALVEQFRSELNERQNSPALMLLVHRENQGVVRTFEDALRAASGDILFLSDDDDRWAPAKVAKVLEAFADSQVQVVSTALELIDEEGSPIASSKFMQHRKFKPGILANLLHNQFQGSALALRSSVLQHVLPFPTRRLYLHDAWIGLRTVLSGGKAVHLEEPLLFYRRHPNNFSRRFSRWKQIKLRLQLVCDLLTNTFSKL